MPAVLCFISLPSGVPAGAGAAVGVRCGVRNGVPVDGSRFCGVGLPALYREADHLKRAFVLIGLVPRPRREHAKRVLAIRDISQLELLAEVVIGLVRLVVEDHVDVVTRMRLRVHRRRVALEVAAELKLDLDRRARDRLLGLWRKDLQGRSGVVLVTAGRHQVLDLLRTVSRTASVWTAGCELALAALFAPVLAVLVAVPPQPERMAIEAMIKSWVFILLWFVRK